MKELNELGFFGCVDFKIKNGQLSHTSGADSLMRTKLCDHLRHFSTPKSYGYKKKTDGDIGDALVTLLGYGKSSPWDQNLAVDDLDGDTRASRSISQKFFMNFSVLGSLGSSFIVGIAHSSHHAWPVDSNVHLGSVTLVEVPKDCMLVFHGLLFHYGGRATWNSTEFSKDLRSFAYLRNEYWASDATP